MYTYYVNESKLLQLALTYKMSKIEAKAWKVAIIYLRLAHLHFPDYKHGSIPKGDPRKSLVFRYAHKLVVEKKLKSSEYRNYLRAQFEILKNIQDDVGIHSLIGPQCMAGEPAWRRWMVWKKKLDQAIQQKNSIGGKAQASFAEVKADLDSTFDFLASKNLSKAEMMEAIKGRVMARWVAIKKVSPYYLVLSSVIAGWVKENGTNLLTAFSIDPKLFIVPDGIMEYFVEKFYELESYP